MTEQFYNIPQEMRDLPQWVVWRLELREASKPTKVPYAPWPGGIKAAVTKSATWGTFEQALQAPLVCIEPCDPELDVVVTGLSGIGFVFTANDPFTGIDLDDTHGDAEAYARQLKIYSEFDSYSELSPSGTGLHIIVKGEIPHGRRRAAIEVYSKERYFTMTGNVHNDKPIAERQKLLQLLFDQMGGAPNTYVYGDDKEQKETDEEIFSKATNASNGEKFGRLYTGDIQNAYTSQSEADFALIDILAFYTQNKAQIVRMFRASALGQRNKAMRDDYVGYMVNKSFDRQLPPVDIEGLKVAFDNMRLGSVATGGEPGSPSTAATPSDNEGLTTNLEVTNQVSHTKKCHVNIFPPGLLGEIAQFLLEAAPRPVPDIALAGAIGLLSGICGRAYNVSGAGLNQYILLLAPTGTGKDAISSGVSKLMTAVMKSTPAAGDFNGPGELVSSAGIIKWLNDKPAVFSILGEVGLLLQQMSSNNANSNLKGLERTLLQLYSKSGQGNVFDPMAYSDRDKNTRAISSPSLTLLGESVPERFYEIMDDSMIASGLLPRFMVFEYKGKRTYLKHGTELIKPSFGLVQKVADVCGQSLTKSHNGQIFDVPFEKDADLYFKEYDKWTTDKINEANSENIKHLWNRAHLKAMKLAAICAIGINPFAPVITMNEANWATDIINHQTMRLIVKFESGNVGQTSGSESRQLRDLIKVISSYMHSDYDKIYKYGGTRDMHRDGVILESHASRRLMAIASFRNDKLGANAALKRTLKMLLDADELREVPTQQMQAKYGKRAKAYVVSNAVRFAVKEDDDD